MEAGPRVSIMNVDRSRPDVLLAATGDGVLLSKDRSLSLVKLDDYTQAAMIHPLDAMIAFAGPAQEANLDIHKNPSVAIQGYDNDRRNIR
jgi:hypothetical protein